MDALIRLEEVTRRYDRDAAPAVYGVSVQVAPGESVAVMGHNGVIRRMALRAATARFPCICDRRGQ